MAAQAKRGQGSTAGGGGDDLLRDAATLCFAPILSRVRGCVVVLDDVVAAHVRTSIGAEAFLTSGATAVIAPGADIPPHARAAVGGGVVALLGGPDLRDTLVGLRASVASCASDARNGGVAVTILIGMTDLQLASVNTAARSDGGGGVKGNPARAGGGTETYDSVASNVRGWPYVSTVSVEYAPLGPATLFPGLCCFPACEGTCINAVAATTSARPVPLSSRPTLIIPSHDGHLQSIHSLHHMFSLSPCFRGWPGAMAVVASSMSTQCLSFVPTALLTQHAHCY